MDHTRAIVEETHRRLLPRAPAGSAEATADGLDAALGKMFVGPAGTITRMHQDAGEAHAWLAQVIGRKLFVCCPPDDAPALRVIEGETETAQSFVDPLDFSSAARDERLGEILDRGAPRCVHARTGGGGGDSARLVALRGRHRSRVDGDAQLYHAGTNAAALVRAVARKLDARARACVRLEWSISYFGKRVDGCSSPRGASLVPFVSFIASSVVIVEHPVDRGVGDDIVDHGVRGVVRVDGLKVLGVKLLHVREVLRTTMPSTMMSWNRIPGRMVGWK